MSTLTVTRSGRVAMADAMMDLLQNHGLCLAVGSGDASWGEDPPPVSDLATALATPFALLRPIQASFVRLDEAGAIEWVDGSRWATSNDATSMIYLRYRLGFQDMPTETVREFGIHARPQFAADVAPGLKVVPWASVAAPGRLFVARRTAPKPRAGSELVLDQMLGF